MTKFMDPENLSGIEILMGRIDGSIASPEIFNTMGMSLVYAEKGLVRLVAKPDKRHLNSMGFAQGGFSACVLDASTWLAVKSMLPSGQKLVTVGLNINLLKPVAVDKGDLTAEGRIVHLSGRIAVANGTILDPEGKQLATGSATCMILKPYRSESNGTAEKRDIGIIPRLNPRLRRGE